MSNSGGLSEIFIVILGVIIILLIIYMYIKEQEINKTFKVLANRSDTINRQLFTLSKNLQKELENYKQEIESEIELMINQQDLGDKQNNDLNNIKNAVEYLLVQNEEMKHLKSRVETVERGLQGIIFDKKSMVDNTENILALYREGRTIEEIVKELGIARRTVEFAIKLHKNNL
jgi:hypothetical protein